MNNDELIGVPNSSQYNMGTFQKQMIFEETATVQNYQTIMNAIDQGRARDISLEPKANETPAFIIGSGASLDLNIEYLKEWKGGIFCTTSHALTLMYHGIEPTHIVALDPFSMWDEIEGVDWSKTKTKLIAHPGIWHDLIKNWPNEILLYRQNIGRRDSFYASTQNRMYTKRETIDGDVRKSNFHYQIRTELTLFACSPPAQMFAAQSLGYGNIFLMGVDFGCTYNKERFTNYTVKTQAKSFNTGNAPDISIPMEWEIHDHPLEKDKKYLYSENGIPTEQIHIYYKKNMISAWRLSLQNVMTTDKGIITEIPFIDIKEVIKTQGKFKKQIGKNNIIKMSEKYLAKVGAFVINTDKGILFVESANPFEDLPRFMKDILKRYTCPSCGMTAQANDDTDHNGIECEVCKKDKITYSNFVDIDKNMKRIKSLLNNSIPKSN